MTQSGQGSPWVTTTDGTNNAIVWVVGAQGDQRLHGYNGDTGAVIYAGTDVMTGTRKWNSGIAARGSIYVANDNKVYAFRIPSGGTPTPTLLRQLLLRSLPLLQRRLQQLLRSHPLLRRLRQPRQLRRQARHRLRQPRQHRRPRVVL